VAASRPGVWRHLASVSAGVRRGSALSAAVQRQGAIDRGGCMKRRAWNAWTACGLGLLACLLAAAAVEGARPPRVHALVGARIVAAPGRVIESGTVVLRDGVIVAVGAKVEVPADARVWDLKGKTIYPGLVESYSVRPWPQAKDGDKGSAKPQGVLDNAMLHPERDMTTWADDDAAAKKLRDAGFTVALVAPKDGILRGRSVVLELGDGSAGRNLLRQDFAQHAALKAAGRGGDDGGAYPVSLMGAIALFRQTLLDAGWYGRAQAELARNPAQERPAAQPALAALAGVAAGRDLVVFETEDVLDTLRVAKVVRELKLRALLVGNGEEYKRLDGVRQTGLPHILPLAFPKTPKVEGTGDAATDLEELRHWDAAPDNPRLLLGTGLTVAFSSHRLDDPKKLYENLARAIKRGLTADQALAALTVTPARLLGLADRLGTIEPGKIANLVVVDGDLFVAKPKLREVWVDGNRYEIKETKAAVVEPAGTWQLTVRSPEGEEVPLTLEVTGRGGALAGSISAMGKTVVPSSIEVSGSQLDIEFDGASFGMPGTFSFSLEISGDSATGSGTSPHGSFTLDGSRSARPAGPPTSSGAAGAATAATPAGIAGQEVSR
jgi:hypothetical protein